MQFRMNDVIVNNVPKLLTIDLAENMHAIIFAGDYGPDSSQTILTLDLHGVILSLNVSALSKDKWTAMECTILVLTSKYLNWDPADKLFDGFEHSQTSFSRDIRRNSSKPHHMVIHAFIPCSNAADITHDDNFATFLDTHVAIDITDSLMASCAVQSCIHKPIDHMTLAK
jgi:hypothetical protein